MPLNIPTDPVELENKSLTDLQTQLPTTANPFLEESWMGAQAIANARRVFDFYRQLRILETEAFPISAVQFLDLWASFWGITLNPATQSSGKIVATGTAGSTITAGTQLTTSNGNLYSVASEVNIVANAVSCTLTSAGLLATATLASDQSLYTGQSVTISGATEPEYNGTFTITVTGTNVFTYVLPSVTTSPATGSPLANFTSAPVSVQSLGFGKSKNLLPNARLTFSTPIVGVNSQAFVDFNELSGGADIETTEELRERLLERVQNPVAMFNVSAIVQQAKKVSGVTDVFVYEITPEPGAVTIYFVRGNDVSPIPSAAEVQTVKDEILKIKPAHTADADVIVLAPTAVNQAFSFSFLSPNTTSMREAIDANLAALFRDEAAVGVEMTENQYISAITNTIDPVTGDKVALFSLVSPAGDIGGGADEYPVYTGSTFP